jgi:hypothetical protein
VVGAVESGAGLIRFTCDTRQMRALPTQILPLATPPSPTASDFAGTNPVRLNRSAKALTVSTISGVFGFVSSLAPGGQLGVAEVIDAALSGALLAVIVYAIVAARSRTPNRRR